MFVIFTQRHIYVYIEGQHFSHFQAHNTAKFSGRRDISSTEKLLVFHLTARSAQPCNPCTKSNIQSYEMKNSIHFNTKSLFEVLPQVSDIVKDNEVTSEKEYNLFERSACFYTHQFPSYRKQCFTMIMALYISKQGKM